jgi:quinol monooxygenase YgiN
MKIITVFCSTTPEHREALIALCRSMIAPSRAEDGCLRYSFYEDLGEKDTFLFYEEWRDQASIDRHNTTKHFLDFSPRFASLITGTPVITVHSAG